MTPHTERRSVKGHNTTACTIIKGEKSECFSIFQFAHVVCGFSLYLIVFLGEPSIDMVEKIMSRYISIHFQNIPECYTSKWVFHMNKIREKLAKRISEVSHFASVDSSGLCCQK